MSSRAFWIAVLCAAAAAGTQSADAQDRRRQQDFDFAIGFPHLQSRTTAFDGGTVVDTKSSTGFGFTFDWHFRDRWSAGATMAMRSIDYTADIALAGSPLGTAGQVVSDELDTQSLMGHVKRYFGDWRRVEPYATAGLGWVSIDTNVPTGPPVGYCWFEPWWGLVCDSYQPTRVSTDAATSLGVGVRWAFSRRVFLDASVGREWIDFDNASRPDFTQLRIAFGINERSRDSRDRTSRAEQ